MSHSATVWAWIWNDVALVPLFIVATIAFLCEPKKTTESQGSLYLACISACRTVIWLLARPCCLLAGATIFISFRNLLVYHRQLWKIKIHTVTIWFSRRLQGEAVGRLGMVRTDFLLTWTVSKLLLTQPRACLDEKWMCSSPCPIVPSKESGIYHERYIKKH